MTAETGPVAAAEASPDFYRDTDGTLYWNLRKHPLRSPGVFDATSSATPLWLTTADPAATDTPIRPADVGEAIGEWCTPEFVRFMGTPYWDRLVALIQSSAATDTSTARDLKDYRRAAHEFTEDIGDASMCACGIPAIYHDQVMARAVRDTTEPEEQPT